MTKNIITSTLLILFCIISNGQSTDYNTKKGVAIQGYDIISYFNGEAKKGASNFTYKYDNITYKFSSQENLNVFKKNPVQYLPQYGGYCAYAIAKKGKKVGVNPKTFEIRDGKLYLFYNSWGTNTLEKWLVEEPDSLVKKANQNWKTIN